MMVTGQVFDHPRTLEDEKSSGLNLHENVGLNRHASPAYTVAGFAGLARLYGPLSPDSLAQVTRATNAGSPARGLDRKTCSAAPSSAALSDLTWFINMWRRLEQRKLHRPNYTKQLCPVRLESQPYDRAAMIRPVPGKHYFLCAETKLHPFDHVCFAPPILVQNVPYNLPMCTQPVFLH